MFWSSLCHAVDAAPVTVRLKMAKCSTRLGKSRENVEKIMYQSLTFPKGVYEFIVEAQGHGRLLRRLQEIWDGRFLSVWDIREVSVSGRVISYLGVLQESGGRRQHAGIFCLISDTSWAAANSIVGLYPRACIHTSKDAC